VTAPGRFHVNAYARCIEAGACGLHVVEIRTQRRNGTLKLPEGGDGLDTASSAVKVILIAAFELPRPPGRRHCHSLTCHLDKQYAGGRIDRGDQRRGKKSFRVNFSSVGRT